MTNNKLKKSLKKRYDSDHDSVISEHDNEEKKEQRKQGKPWTKAGVFNSYEEALKLKESIIKKSPEFNTKIKRCGVKQSKFKVLKRKDEELTKKTKTKKSRSKDEKGSTVGKQ